MQVQCLRGHLSFSNWDLRGAAWVCWWDGGFPGWHSRLLSAASAQPWYKAYLSADFQPVAWGSDSHLRHSLCGYLMGWKEHGLAMRVCHHITHPQLSGLFLKPLVWLHRRGARTCPRAAQLLLKLRVPFFWQCAWPQREINAGMACSQAG